MVSVALKQYYTMNKKKNKNLNFIPLTSIRDVRGIHLEISTILQAFS